MENSKKELKPEEMDKIAAGEEEVIMMGDAHQFSELGTVFKDIYRRIYKKGFIPEKKLD